MILSIELLKGRTYVPTLINRTTPSNESLELKTGFFTFGQVVISLCSRHFFFKINIYIIII